MLASARQFALTCAAMKHVLRLVLIALLATLPCVAQQRNQKSRPAQLDSLLRVLNQESLVARLNWEVVANKLEIGKIRSGKQMALDAKVWFDNKSEDTARNRPFAESKLLHEYRGQIVDLIQKFTLLGSSQLGQFVTPEQSIPVRFADKNGASVLLLTDIASENTFNILRVSSRERATKVLETIILPSLTRFHDALGKTSIKYYGMFVCYGSRDFSNNSDVLNLKGEAIAFIVSVQHCAAFLNGKLTEDALLKAADIFLADREMLSGVKRIEVKLN